MVHCLRWAEFKPSSLNTDCYLNICTRLCQSGEQKIKTNTKEEQTDWGNEFCLIYPKVDNDKTPGGTPDFKRPLKNPKPQKICRPNIYPQKSHVEFRSPSLVVLYSQNYAATNLHIILNTPKTPYLIHNIT